MTSPGKWVLFCDCGLFMGEILVCVCKIVNNKVFSSEIRNTLVVTIVKWLGFSDDFRFIFTNPLLRPIEYRSFVARCNEMGYGNYGSFRSPPCAFLIKRLIQFGLSGI